MGEGTGCLLTTLLTGSKVDYCSSTKKNHTSPSCSNAVLTYLVYDDDLDLSYYYLFSASENCLTL